MTNCVEGQIIISYIIKALKYHQEIELKAENQQYVYFYFSYVE